MTTSPSLRTQRCIVNRMLIICLQSRAASPGRSGEESARQRSEALICGVGTAAYFEATVYRKYGNDMPGFR